MIQYNLIRSRRKTLAIHVTKDAAVEVRAPLKMAKADIDRFVAEKEKWIETHLARQKLQNEKKSAFVLNIGDMIPLCGKLYPITSRVGNRAGFDGQSFYLPAELPPALIKVALVRTYKILAKSILSERVGQYKGLLKVTPAAINISGAKTRWGSCSGKNSITFSWRLIMTDENVIDYVVVHELAHIMEHNHSVRFWKIVESVLPDYKNRQKELKQFQKTFAAQDWET